MFQNAKKDTQLVNPDWTKIQNLIDGVEIREVLHVPRDHGVITEIFRASWLEDEHPVEQVYQSRLFPGAIGAWSCHAKQTDRCFVNQGLLKVVLYDARENSPTHGKINEFHAGDTRPTYMVIPPGVWHGIQNLGTTDALMINMPTIPYQYADPDHFRLPYDAPEIPYQWLAGGVSSRLRADARFSEKP
jgi:dTDP-4-dehydrorhamnose 3,5-epimerase